MTSENQNVRNQVNMRLTDSEYKKLIEQSARMGKSKSEVMRLNFKSRIDVLSQRRIEMPNEERQKMFEKLDELILEMKELKRDNKKFGRNYNEVAHQFSLRKYNLPEDDMILVSENLSGADEYIKKVDDKIANVEKEISKIWQLLK